MLIACGFAYWQQQEDLLRWLWARHVRHTVVVSAGYRQITGLFDGMTPDPHFDAAKAVQARREVRRCGGADSRGGSHVYSRCWNVQFMPRAGARRHLATVALWAWPLGNASLEPVRIGPGMSQVTTNVRAPSSQRRPAATAQTVPAPATVLYVPTMRNAAQAAVEISAAPRTAEIALIRVIAVPVTVLRKCASPPYEREAMMNRATVVTCTALFVGGLSAGTVLRRWVPDRCAPPGEADKARLASFVRTQYKLPPGASIGASADR